MELPENFHGIRKPPGHLPPMMSQRLPPVEPMQVSNGHQTATAEAPRAGSDDGKNKITEQLLHKQFSIFASICQVIFMVLFGVFCEYSPSSKPVVDNLTSNGSAMIHNDGHFYPMFQDVHVMIFVGFGFLMTFLKRYGFSAVGINFLLAAFILEWAILVRGFFRMENGKFNIGMTDLLNADFSAAAVLISMGAMLGKLSPTQYLIMGLLETVCSMVNEHIVFSIFKANDVGGSMVIHAFGAYFGLTMSRILNRDVLHDHPAETTAYHSDIFSMIGSVFLWIFWPSFNAIVADPLDARHRAVINTFLSLAGSCIAAFLVSSLVDSKGKFVMVHIQNATLAGGVAVGTAANLLLQPFGALIIGTLSGVISVLGFKFVTPFMASKLGFHDTCGVNNLHGMPAILAAIVGIIAAKLADKATYGESLSLIFPAMAMTEEGRTSDTQALFQLAALGTSLGISIVGGLLTGLILKLNIWNNVSQRFLYDDGKFWETPDDFDQLKNQ